MFERPQAHDPQTTVIVRRSRWKLWIGLLFAVTASIALVARIKGLLPGEPLDDIPKAWFVWFVVSLGAAAFALQLLNWRQAILVLSPDGILDRRNSGEIHLSWNEVTAVRLRQLRFFSYVLLHLSPAAQNRLFTSPIARRLSWLDNRLLGKSGIAIYASDNQISPARLAAICRSYLEASRPSNSQDNGDA